jgi:hypothetical protein
MEQKALKAYASLCIESIGSATTHALSKHTDQRAVIEDWHRQTFVSAWLAKGGARDAIDVPLNVTCYAAQAGAGV